VTETDGLADVGRLVVSAVQGGSAVEFSDLEARRWRRRPQPMRSVRWSCLTERRLTLIPFGGTVSAEAGQGPTPTPTNKELRS
jgi:hypothetical protein